MGSGGDEISHGATRIPAGDQAFPDEDGVGTRAGVGQQVGGAADPGLGDPDHVAGQPRRDPGEAVEG